MDFHRRLPRNGLNLPGLIKGEEVEPATGDRAGVDFGEGGGVELDLGFVVPDFIRQFFGGEGVSLEIHQPDLVGAQDEQVGDALDHHKFSGQFGDGLRSLRQPQQCDDFERGETGGKGLLASHGGGCGPDQISHRGQPEAGDGGEVQDGALRGFDYIFNPSQASMDLFQQVAALERRPGDRPLGLIPGGYPKLDRLAA